jgi:hypothetical protein
MEGGTARGCAENPERATITIFRSSSLRGETLWFVAVSLRRPRWRGVRRYRLIPGTSTICTIRSYPGTCTLYMYYILRLPRFLLRVLVP